MRRETIPGVKGSRRAAAAVAVAVGSVAWGEGSRQGVVPARVLGDIVRVIAYERRR